MEYNVYCDESSHLISNDNKYMILGAVYCPKNKVRNISKYIKELKKKHGLKENSEIKWTKISKSKIELYNDLIEYFFVNTDLKFRAVVCDKSILDHGRFNQTHDDWYHKMYYDMLIYFTYNENSYNIYPDTKDSNSYYNFQKVANYLRYKLNDTNNKTIKKIQPILSNESYIIQLADLLVGALNYNFRSEKNSDSKKQILDLLNKRVVDGIDKTTPYSKNKFNILVWEPRKND